MSFRVAVLVSGEGTNLQAILDDVHGREDIEVVCVGSNRPEARGLERARSADVETGVFPAADYADRAERDRALGDWLEAREVDLVDEGVDSGPVIFQESFEVPYARGIDAIEQTFHDVEHRLLPRAIRLIAKGAVRIDPSNPRLVLVEGDAEG